MTLDFLDKNLFLSSFYAADPDKINRTKMEFHQRENELKIDRKILEKYNHQAPTLFKNSFADRNDRILIRCCDCYLKAAQGETDSADLDRIEKRLLLALFMKIRCTSWRSSGFKEAFKKSEEPFTNSHV